MSEAPHDEREASLMAKLSRPEASEPPWSLLGAVLTVFAMFICLIVIGPALVSMSTTREVLFPFELMVSWSIGLALTIVFVLFSRRSSEESWHALLLTKGSRPLPMSLLLGIAIALALDLTVNLANGQFRPPPHIWGFQLRGAFGLVLAALMLIVLQPLAETLVFQGVLLPRMRWTFGHRGGLIGASALYTALYNLVFIQPYAFYDKVWHGIAFPMGIGILFCLLKVYTQSTGAVLLARTSAGLIFLLTAVAIYGG